MKLLHRQRLLAQAKLEGLNDWEACLKAGYKPSTHQSACNQVAKLMKNPEFTTYLESLHKAAESVAVKTALDIKQDLSELMNDAKSEKDYRNYVAMAARLCKLCNYDEEPKEQTVIKTSPVCYVAPAHHGEGVGGWTDSVEKAKEANPDAQVFFPAPLSLDEWEEAVAQDKERKAQRDAV
ncbi:hypothetical protein [Rubritalea marina]|uniref:hypothetical protein n=1 Tax=Rubritalea marina TaxID=361055 RepID=UPI00037FA891|nr:hypothetical protein [Rubritalea marina]